MNLGIISLGLSIAGAGAATTSGGGVVGGYVGIGSSFLPSRIALVSSGEKVGGYITFEASSQAAMSAAMLLRIVVVGGGAGAVGGMVFQGGGPSPPAPAAGIVFMPSGISSGEMFGVGGSAGIGGGGTGGGGPMGGKGTAGGTLISGGGGGFMNPAAGFIGIWGCLESVCIRLVPASLIGWAAFCAHGHADASGPWSRVAWASTGTRTKSSPRLTMATMEHWS